MNRINEIGDTPRGQKALGAVFARAHNRKNWCDKNMVEPYRKDSKDYWQNVERNASSEVGRNAKDKLKGFENFGDGAQEYYKNHLPNDTIQIPQHESKNGNMNKKLIRLTEQDLHRIVKESVTDILNKPGGANPFVHELNCIFKSLANLTSIIAASEIKDSAYGDIFNELLTVLKPYCEKISQAQKYGLSSL